jgi:SAM-dependent methyltransferase
MSERDWQWHPSLYSSSAAHYVQGRVSYSQELVDALVAELGLDGQGRLLDVGCGPGSLTLLLAPWFEHATGLDADAGMLAEGARQAAAAGIGNVDWVNRKAEDLDSDLGPFRAVTLAQSFHWMDQARVARLLHGVLSPDGVLVHVQANTYEGIDGDLPLSHPAPPRREIDKLVTRFLGSRTRPGPGGREPEIYRAAGFSGPTRIELPDRVVVRSVDDIVAGVFSLSFAAPHLFGDRVDEFETALRALLAEASPEGRFSEQMREAVLDIWRP